MLANELHEIRKVRMQLRSSPAAQREMESAISAALAKHRIDLSNTIASQLTLTTEAELDTNLGVPGPPLPVGINCK